MTSSTMFLKTQQISRSFGRADCGCLREFQIQTRCFLSEQPPGLRLSSYPSFSACRWGQGLVKNSWAAFEQQYVLAERGFEKWKAITLQWNVFCLDLWLLIELHLTTTGPCLKDSISLLWLRIHRSNKHSPTGNTASLLSILSILINAKWLSLYVSAVIVHHPLLNSVLFAKQEANVPSP